MSIFSIFSKSKKTSEQPSSISKISQSITRIFTHQKIDQSTIEELEDTLIEGDIAVSTCRKIISPLKEGKFNKNISAQEVRATLTQEIIKILDRNQKKLDLSIDSESKKPKVLIFNGVNGSGKTTTIGKIAHNLNNSNKKVLIAACDTYRAGAADQLEIWAQRSNCDIVRAQKEGQDPASVAFQSLKKAQEEGYDFLLIDTAGRLQNKKNLMDELGKINHVLRKIDPNAPDENILVLDGTIGQNAKSQTEIFNEIVNISGLIITKLDGSAKGGIAVTLADEFNKPIYAIGKGEKVADLQEFDSLSYTNNLIGQ